MKRLIPAFFILVHLASIARGVPSLEVHIREGEAHIAAGRFLQALESCRAGLKGLGNSYVTSEVEDDTGLKLMATDRQLKEGRIENAAVVTCRIFKEQFDLWEKKQGKKPNHSFNPDALKRAG